MDALSCKTMTRRARGVTLIEFLVALAIIGILASIGFVNLRPPSARLLANDYQAMLQQARLESIKRNRPVMVVWDGTQFISRVKDDNQVSCTADNTTQLRVKRVDEYPHVQVTNPTGTGTGIVWLPSGMARTCANGLNVTGSITFAKVGGGTSIQVSISQSGRVRVGT